MSSAAVVIGALRVSILFCFVTASKLQLLCNPIANKSFQICLILDSQTSYEYLYLTGEDIASVFHMINEVVNII